MIVNFVVAMLLRVRVRVCEYVWTSSDSISVVARWVPSHCAYVARPGHLV